MKLKKTCLNCINGLSVGVNSDILCRNKGIVSADFVCTRHNYLNDSKSFKSMNFRCIDCENFTLKSNNPDDIPDIGICQLFSVRYFNGKSKNACSKFSKKHELEVS